MWIHFTDDARRIVFYAQEHAVRLGVDAVGSEHFMLGFLDDNEGGATQVLTHLQVDKAQLRADVERQLTPREAEIHRNTVQLNQDSKKIVDNAYEAAHVLSSRAIRSEHLLLGATQLNSAPVGEILRAHGVTYETVLRAVRAIRA